MISLKEMTTRLNELDPRVRLNWGIGCAVCLCLALLYSLASDQVKRLEKLRIAREADIAELLVLKQRFREASAVAQRAANRQAAVRPDDSATKLVEETGIKGKSLQI